MLGDQGGAARLRLQSSALPRCVILSEARSRPAGKRESKAGVPSTRAPGLRRFCAIWDGSDPGSGLLGWKDPKTVGLTMLRQGVLSIIFVVPVLKKLAVQVHLSIPLPNVASLRAL